MENLDVIAGVFVATDLNNGVMVHGPATSQKAHRVHVATDEMFE